MTMVRVQPLHQAHRQAQALLLLQPALSDNAVAAGNGLLDPSELHAVLSVSPAATHLEASVARCTLGLQDVTVPTRRLWATLHPGSPPELSQHWCRKFP